MGIATSIDRLIEYHQRHGFGATVKRAALGSYRALFARHMVVFSCDLAKEGVSTRRLASSLSVERVRSLAELGSTELQKMISFWSPKQADRNIRERFELGASLWLIKREGQLAGYGWTIQGSTIEPYFIALTADDAHLFDFHVFPEYRGQGLNPALVAEILRLLSLEARGRAFIEVAEWNEPQLASLKKTPFRYFGKVSSITLLGRKAVKWADRAA